MSTLGEEGPPSPPSTIVEAFDGDSVAISNLGLPAAPFSSYISQINIYRTATGTELTSFFYVKSVAANATTASDDVLTENLGDELLSTEWVPPPDAMKGIVTLANGCCAGFDGRTVLLSEPYQPHAWPYAKYVDFDIVALAPLGDGLLILTDGYPYIASGSHPRAMSLRRVEFEQPCVSARSVASVRDTVLYASSDGLVAISPQGYRVLSEPYFTRREWQALGPDSMLGVVYDQVYYGFFETRRSIGDAYGSNRTTDTDYRIIKGPGMSQVLVFDPVNENVGLSYFDEYAVAAHYAPEPDRLYFVNEAGQIVELGGGLSPTDCRTLQWRSGLVKTKYPLNPGTARVDAVRYPLTFRLYANGQLRTERVVRNAEAFRLPAGYLTTDFEVEIESAHTVRSIQVGETMIDVAQG
jgi:hypothetical protein